MPLEFERPVGAVADVRELEYISALHQTGFMEIRKNGSIIAIDIVRFLSSRYGIKVSEEEVKENIFKSFGGGGVHSADGMCIDLVEMLAMLLIPLLLKAERHVEQKRGDSSANLDGDEGLGDKKTLPFEIDVENAENDENSENGEHTENCENLENVENLDNGKNVENGPTWIEQCPQRENQPDLNEEESLWSLEEGTAVNEGIRLIGSFRGMRKLSESTTGSDRSSDNFDQSDSEMSNDFAANNQDLEESTIESFQSAFEFQEYSVNNHASATQHKTTSEMPSLSTAYPSAQTMSKLPPRSVRFSDNVSRHSYSANEKWNTNVNSNAYPGGSILKLPKPKRGTEETFIQMNSSLAPTPRTVSILRRSFANRQDNGHDGKLDQTFVDTATSTLSNSNPWNNNSLSNEANVNNNDSPSGKANMGNINHNNIKQEKDTDSKEFKRSSISDRYNERWPPDDLLQRVLSILLRDVISPPPNGRLSGHHTATASSLSSLSSTSSKPPSPPILTKDLMKDILLFYGEREMAQNERLVRDMIFAAAGQVRTGDDDECDNNDNLPFVRLDEHAFARALTHDIQKYDIHFENRVSTNYFDVFQTLYSTKKSNNVLYNLTMEDETSSSQTTAAKVAATVASGVGGPYANGTIPDSEAEKHGFDSSQRDIMEGVSRTRGLFATKEEKIPTRPIQRIFTFPSIDYTADTFRNRTFVVTLWVTYVLTYFAYLSQPSMSFGDLRCNQDVVNNSFGCIIAEGILRWVEVMIELSIIGTIFLWLSSIGNTVYPTHPFYILVGIASVVVVAILPFVDGFSIGTYFSTEKAENSGRRFLYFSSFIGGCLLLFLKVLSLVDAIIPLTFLMEHNRLAKIFLSSNVKNEAKLKRAAGFKINRLINNAIEVHDMAVEEEGREDEEIKGSTAVSNFSHYGQALLSYAKLSDKIIVDGGICWAWKNIWNGDLYSREGIWLSTRIIAGNFGQLVVCITFLVFGGLFTRSNQYGMVLDTVDQDEKWRVILPAVLGILFGLLAAVCLAVTLLPSAVKTTLQFRCGYFRSLNDKTFLDYRVAIEQQSLLFGSIFWGALYTAVIVGFVFGGVILAILHPSTSQISLGLIASLIGLSITALVKVGFLMCVRSYFYAGFYRKKPAHANFIGIILESWNLGLTTGYLVVRSIKLILAALLFIGRIDIPLIEDSANRIIGPLKYDGYPMFFRKEILAHEAHRHPYIERLGVMYMMKLRYGDLFGHEAGTSWRLLFIFALMPWMRKYRLDMDDNEIDVTYFKIGNSKSWSGRIPLKALTSIPKEVVPSRIIGNKLDAANNGGVNHVVLEDAVSSLAHANSSLASENHFLKKELEKLRKSMNGPKFN